MSPQSSNGQSTEATEGQRSVGQGNYVVKQGECIDSIAFENGFFWETIWNHAENSALKQKRKDPNILLAGDEVFIPDKEEKKESCATEQRHRFRRKGVPAMIRIRLLEEPLPDEGPADAGTDEEETPVMGEEEVDEDVPTPSKPSEPSGPSETSEPSQQQREEPLANEPYEIIIDGKSYTGRTDEEGALSVPIPPNASRGQLWVGEEPGRRLYELDLGHVDPVSEMTGVQQRLNNLGFDCGAVDGRCGPRTRRALERFQQRHGLSETGEPDDQTRQRLTREHGS